MKTAQRSFCFAVLVSLVVAGPIAAQTNGPLQSRPDGFVYVTELAGSPGAEGGSAFSQPDATAAIRSSSRLGAPELHDLGPLTLREHASLNDRTRTADSELIKVGLARRVGSAVGLDESHVVSIGDRSVGGGLVERHGDRMFWTAGFRSDGAGALRLCLENVRLPHGAVAYVYSEDGEVHGPLDLGDRDDAVIWTNTVFSDSIFLEVQIPLGARQERAPAPEFRVSAVMHIDDDEFAPGTSRETEAAEANVLLPSCFVDVACVSESDYPGLTNASKAVALIVFVSGTSSYVCSGALLNAASGTSVPYFLTANHCVSSEQSAESVEAFWDYRTASCGGADPGLSQTERTLGSKLLATGSVSGGESDFSLLRFEAQPPAGRYYLGWTTSDISTAGSTRVYRVGHPSGGPQAFTLQSVSASPTPGECSDLPQGRFIYSKNDLGATRGGSSGAPAILADGLKLIGQLYGRCGQNLADACDAVQNSSVDGAFAMSYRSIAGWIAVTGRQHPRRN